MIYKSAAGMIALAAFLFAAPASAQIEEGVGGYFYASCAPTDGPATTIELSNHVRIIAYGAMKPDEAYRTPKETFEGEKPGMQVNLCDDKMQNCKSVEGILSTHRTGDDEIEATIEYFDGTETQGDAESIQGHTISFTVQRDKVRSAPTCG